MDLLSSIRKEGSRGGVDFKWSDVETSQHRENYLGHSLKAPVGRWQRNKDLSWYAKPDSGRKILNKDGLEETDAERNVRERKEEIRRVKEAEENAMARALGLPVIERDGLGTGANSVDVSEMNRVIKETEAGDEEIDEVGRGRRFGDFVGKVGIGEKEITEALPKNEVRGGLVEKDEPGRRVKPTRDEDKRRSLSRSRDRRHRRPRHNDSSRDGRDRNRNRYPEDQRRGERKRIDRSREERGRNRNPAGQEWRRRSRSPERHRERRGTNRSKSHSPSWRGGGDRSIDRYVPRRDERGRRRSSERWSKRSRSPGYRPRERDGARERRR